MNRPAATLDGTNSIGCSGARILVTLIAALNKRGGAAICIGGGEGLAARVELI